MKIAMVSEHASPLGVIGGVDAGGQNVHVAALAGQLAGRGHDVTVFTRRDDPSSPDRVVAPGGYAVEHVPAGPPTEVPKDELLPFMHRFGQVLARRWSEERYDIAHAHFWMSGLATTQAARVVGVPVVQTFHALGTVKRRHQGREDTSPPARISLEARLCADVDHVVATCSDEIGELVAMGLDPGRASVVPCGVDLDAFRPHRSSAAGRRRHRLLTVGRLVPRKGVSDVIEALTRLPDAELVVAGGPAVDALDVDPEVVRLREIARANGVEDRVIFVGRVTRADLPALFGSADVVVAVPWYEPFGIVPLEAMACGRPVVGSAVGGLLDTVVPGVTGELVPPRRPDRLAGALRTLLDDPGRCAAYGNAGLERVRQTYSWARVARDTEQVYEAVVARATNESLEVTS
jgi:glycosyltransferase involved in cell wall biosynthesis